MAIDRRTLLLGSVLVLSTQSRLLAGASSEAGDAALVSACRTPDGRYAIVLLSLDGHVVREIALSDRGHDIALDRKRGKAVAFSRRPGAFAVSFSTKARDDDPVVFSAQDNRNFSGHGIFSTDGRLLYATENDIETGAGLLGIYDVAAGYRRIGEMATHGVDPHEVILLADGKTLVVANGGIEMSGREKLNIETMQPSLVFLDAKTGERKAKHQLGQEINRLSIRHIAADANGQVWFGGQWEGALTSSPELVGRASLDKPLNLITTPAPMGTALKGYIGSVAVSGDGLVLAAAAPRAGRTIFVSTQTGTVIAEAPLADGCGVANLDAHDFVLSSGHGDLVQEDPGHARKMAVKLAGTEFDNHLRRIR